jgi:hypothetical protein
MGDVALYSICRFGGSAPAKSTFLATVRADSPITLQQCGKFLVRLLDQSIPEHNSCITCAISIYPMQVQMLGS